MTPELCMILMEYLFSILALYFLQTVFYWECVPLIRFAPAVASLVFTVASMLNKRLIQAYSSTGSESFEKAYSVTVVVSILYYLLKSSIVQKSSLKAVYA